MTLRLLLRTAALLLLPVAPALAGGGEHPGPATPTLEFIENKGQWDARARYVAPLPGGRLFAETTGLTFALLASDSPATAGQPARGHAGTPVAAVSGQALRGHALTLRFAGARPATITAETPTAEHRNYFRGRDPARWAADVRSFHTLHYAGLWPGVRARVYESSDQQLEYDFEVAPGASPAAIGLRAEGAEDVTLDAATGNLVIKTTVGTITQRAPVAWQTTAGGQRRPVACRFVLAGGVARFALGAYDTKRALTIDPVVVFSTYSGSVADNWGFTAAYDAQGNLYSGGIAFDVGYPTSPGAFQTSFAALIDIAIIKYNTSVSGPAARVWATYLGGDGPEFPHSLVVNSQGELLVLGSSGSSNYPTTAGALQRTFGGGTATQPFGFFGSPYDMPTGSDLVVTRLNAAATALVGSTYLGGSANDGVLPLDPGLAATSATPQLPHNYGDPFRGDILVDADDNVYIASHTASANFPVARGFAGTYRGGTSDGVVCKLAPNLTALTWASFLGGSGADAAYSIQLEPATGDVYVAGGTLSPNFPVTPGAYRTARPGNVDGFAVRIAASGTALLRASYVGTAAYDQAYFLQLGTDGGVYLLGQTLGAWPVSAGVFSTAGGTQFIQKLDANLSQSLVSTAFGSTDPSNAGRVALNPTAFLVDRCDRVYVCGWGGMVNGWNGPGAPSTTSYLSGNGSTIGLPLSSDATQRATDGSDFYLAQFSAGLGALSYGTYYGNPDPFSSGEHVDGGTSRFDPRGVVYQAVCSCFSRTGFPIPPGANSYSTTNGSNPATAPGCNNAAFVLNFQPNIANAGLGQTLCASAGPLALAGSPTGGVWTGPGVSGSVATGFVFTPSAALVGLNTLTYTVVNTGLCTTTDTRRVTVLPPLAVRPDTTLCAGSTQPLALRGSPAGGIFSGVGVSGSVTTGFVFTPPAGFSGTVTLTYTVPFTSCSTSNSVNQRVSVAQLPALSPFWVPVACAEDRLAPLTVRFAPASSPAGGAYSSVQWDFGDGSQSTEATPTHTYATPGTYQPRVLIRYNADRCQTQAPAPPITVVERKIPNIITPNGDALNQTFRLGPGCPPRLQVFSRWGQLVFESPTYRDDWNASGQPDGVYYYLLSYPDGHRVKGWVEVVR